MICTLAARTQPATRARNTIVARRLPRLTSLGVGASGAVPAPGSEARRVGDGGGFSELVTGGRFLAHPAARFSRALAAALALIAPALPSEARADPLPTNDYAIDLFQGPLLSPIRVTSLGGAYAGFAEGTAGLVSSAASPAARPLEAIRHVEVALSGSLSFPVDLFENNDFDNSGEIDSDYSDFVYLTGGAILQVGAFGAGLHAELQTYSLTSPEGRSTNVAIGRYHGLLGVSLGRGQLALGGGARGVTLGIGTPERDLAYAGAAPELGVLVRPSGVPFRFGATYRFAVDGHPTFDPPAPASPGQSSRSGSLTLPNGLVLPWELETGVAVQIGPRPLQVAFDDPNDLDDRVEEAIERARSSREAEREARIASAPDPIERTRLEAALDAEERRLRRIEDAQLERTRQRALDEIDDAYASLARDRILLLLSVLVSGPVEDGVSVERFLAQTVPGLSTTGVIGGSGASVNFSPRFGVEVEPIPTWLILRAGSYYEPNRFGGVGRQHFTFGSEVRLFESDVFGLVAPALWGATAAIDLSPRYESVSVSLAIFR